MKKNIRQTVSNYLRQLTKNKLKRCHGKIIGITGSIGKTSTRAATVHILKNYFSVDQTTANYNTDFGLMLSILKQSGGGKSPLKWLKSIIGGTFNSFFDGKKFDQLVLEMGVDKPGDMADILKITKPHIGIITSIAPVHLGKKHFQDINDIAREKALLVQSLNKHSQVILNHDSLELRKIKNIKAPITWFGVLNKPTDLEQRPLGVYASKIKTTKHGIQATIHYQDQKATIDVPILGTHHVYILLPAIAAALHNDLTLKEACAPLKTFQLPPGRMNLIPGIKKSMIIDSSYNASPESVKAALKTLWEYPCNRRIAVLGSMNELGKISSKSHQEIGRLAPKYVQLLITVGEKAKKIAATATKNGLPAHLCKSFMTATEAGNYLQQIIRKGDTLLIKGSQNKIRLERCIKLIMQNPDQAKNLLVRQ